MRLKIFHFPFFGKLSYQTYKQSIEQVNLWFTLSLGRFWSKGGKVSWFKQSLGDLNALTVAIFQTNSFGMLTKKLHNENSDPILLQKISA